MGGKEYDPEQSTIRSLTDWFLKKKKKKRVCQEVRNNLFWIADRRLATNCSEF